MKYRYLLLMTVLSTASVAQVFQKYSLAPINVVGNTSWASAWGDYDNDNDLDLYVCNYYQGNFLYRNDGNGTFTKITSGALVTSSVGHWSTTWVDYDNDGDLDNYVVNSYTDNNELFRNNGNGTFTSISSAITNTSGTNDNNAAWGDTDNDGDLDLFLANGSNSTPETRNENNSYFINNGNGTFTQNTTSIIATDGGFSQFGNFGDYDNDGDADLIVINTFQDNFFYENKGGGSFVKVLDLPFLQTGEQPLTACWGDFNNDGNMDLVIGSYTDSRIYYNNGDRTFRTGTFPAISGNATGVSVGDFNLDGYLDVIFIRTGQNSLYYLNNGNETFTMTNAGDLTGISLDYTNSGAVGDYDNDGDLDVYINNDNSENLLLENQEITSNWIAFRLVGITSNVQGVGAKVKINVNGKWQTREVGIASSYRTQNSILAHFGIQSASSIDTVRVIWPSGKIQNITTIRKINTNFTIYENVDFYDFEQAPSSVITTDSYDTRSNSWADYDMDGDMDVLVGNISDTKAINLYQNQGNNTFIDRAGTSIPNLAGTIYSSTWGDYDNDGDADLFVTNNDLNKPNALYRSNGNGTLTKIASGQILNEITYSQGSSWADYDNDGNLDMFVSNWHYLMADGTNSLYQGDGNGMFTKISNTAISQDVRVASNKMAWSDVDNDGDTDALVETVALEKTILYLNKGDSTFTKDLEWQNSPSNLYSIGAAFGDYDNDGDQDLYISYDDRLFNNDGFGRFTPVTGTTFDDEHSDGAAWGDYDNDGDLDLYLANGGGPRFNSLFRNEGNGSFTKLNSMVAQDAANSRSTSWVDINNDHYLDLFVGNIGQNKLFVNTGTGLHGLQINLDGVQSNGLGIGAKVRVKTGDTWQIREVFSQQSSLLRTHFGLNNSIKADIVRVEWPSGNVQIVRNVSADQIVTLVEENSPNSAHALSLVVSTDEDSNIAFHSSDFKNAFKDEDGDHLAKIKILSLSTNGQLILGSTPVAIGQFIKLSEIDKLKFNPSSNFNGDVVIQLGAIDGRGLAMPGTLTIHVFPVNDAPIISSIADRSAVGRAGDLVTINFDISDVDNSLASLTLSAASSDEAVIKPGNISITRTTGSQILNITIDKTGTSTIALTVSDGSLSAKSSITLSVTIKKDQVITFDAIAAKKYGDSPFALTASADSGLPLTFTSADVSIASIVGNVVTINGIGEVMITASSPGDANFFPASTQRTLVINKGDQVITFDAIADKIFVTSSSFNLQGVASSGLTVAFSTSSDHISINGNQVAIVSPGHVTIEADQAGNSFYNPALQASQTFCIQPVKPEISVSNSSTVTTLLTSSASLGNQWYRNDVALTNETSNTLEVSEIGTYYTIVTIETCSSQPSDPTEIIITSTEDLTKGETDFLYPNPATSKLYCELNSLRKERVQVEISSITGTYVSGFESESNKFELDITHLAKGLYVITAKQRSGIRVLKLIKE